MSSVIALKSRNDIGVTVLTDKIILEQNYKTTSEELKTFFAGPFIVGVCGDYSVGQHLRHHMNWNMEDLNINNIHKKLIVELMPKLKQSLETLVHPVFNPTIDFELMLVWQSEIFLIDKDLTVFRCEKGFAAIGLGKEYARGAYGVLDAIGYKFKNDSKILTKIHESIVRQCPGISDNYEIFSSKSL